MACMTPTRSQRKLAAQPSDESLGGKSEMTDMCVSPPPEKRRRLTLLFKSRSIKMGEEVDDLKKVRQVVEAEAWENTSTAVPDSDGTTPKTTSGTVTPESRLFDDDRRDSDEEEEDAFGMEEQHQDVSEEEEEAFGAEESHKIEEGEKRQRRPLAAFGSMSSMALPGGCGERHEMAVLRVCAHARDLVRGVRAAGSQILSEEAFFRAQVLACYFVQVNARSSFSPLQTPQMLEDSDDVAEIAMRVACQACRAGGLSCSADSAEQHASEAAKGSGLGSGPLRLPLDFLEGVVEGLVGRLPRSEAFRTHFAARRGEPPHAAARSLAPGLLQVARRFVADSFLSANVALRLEPRSVAAAAVALAATFELRRNEAEVPSEELFAFLAMEAGSLVQLRRATTEMVEVFRLWRDLQKRCDGEQKDENNNSGSDLGADAA
mmetsp:Transcript_11468/g.31038  ORF Transcript_11468/g.31038 Transcript_11468/m.31038 type:complete len:433 (-) Transcript_11468:42-1340(-)